MPNESSQAQGGITQRSRLATRRLELHDLIEREQLGRAMAALEGHDHDGALLRAAQDEQEAIDWAEGELSRRERAAAIEISAKERAKQRRRANKVLSLWLTHIDDAEAAALRTQAALADSDKL